jgi:isoleucyl-tRNA synthetase
MWRVGPVVDASFEAAVLAVSNCPSGSPGSGEDGTVHVEQVPEQSLVALDAKVSMWSTDLGRVATLLDAPLAGGQLVQLPPLASDAPREVGPHAGRSASADALRWATYTGTTPEQAEQDFLQPLWRLVADFQAADSRSGKGEGADPRSEFLGSWLRASLYQAVGSIGEALDAGDVSQAAGQLARLVRDLSTHFMPGQPASGGTLLMVLTQLLAPFVPHLAEAIHRRLFKSTEDSLHLAPWPIPDPEWADSDLLVQMSQLQRLAALGSAARSRAGIEQDVHLRRAIINQVKSGRSRIEGSAAAEDLLTEMLGVDRLQFVEGPVEHHRWQVELRGEQGIERGALSSDIHAAMAALGPEKAAEVAAQLRAGLSVGLDIGDQVVTLLPDEVRISVQGEPGWIAAEGPAGVVTLELN